jgi:DNA-directed RNA polymerase II subunit RPB2
MVKSVIISIFRRTVYYKNIKLLKNFIYFFVEKQETMDHIPITPNSVGMCIVQGYYQITPASNLQLESYNTLVNESLQSIIQDSSISLDIDKNHELLILFKNIYVDSAYIYDEHRNKKYLHPNEARIRDLNYETTVCADIECVTTIKTPKNAPIYPSQPSKSQHYLKVNLFSLPVMVNSSLCHLCYGVDKDECEYDRGGYFIIRGKERVIVAQERINYDKVYVFQKANSKFRYTGELRSIKEDADYSVLVQVHLSYSDELFVSLPYINHPIPLQIVFIALGMDCQEIRELHRGSPILQKCMTQFSDNDVDGGMTRREALEYISQYIQYSVSISDMNKRVIYTEQILEHEIVPHLGLIASTTERAKFLNIIIKKVLDTAQGLRECDDRDHICNKRVEMVGDLIGNLVKSLFKKSLKSIQKDIQKRAEYNIVTLINRFCITPKIYHCFATGNWGIPKSNYIRQGVSQILSRLSYIGTLSHLRRLMVPIGKESKNTKVRQINSTSFGYIDPIETPEVRYQ